MTVLVVTGTDTGVGKTVVVAALAALARARGLAVAVVKPAQTGVAATAPGDVDAIRRLSRVQDVHELARWPDALPPATAARRAGTGGIGTDAIVSVVSALGDRDLVLVEGAGGLLVRLDREGTTLADAAAALCAPVLVVAAAGLGTLNATALTCEALRVRALECAGVVIGSWPAAPDLATRCNLDDLPAYAGAPLLERLPDGAGVLEPDAFLVAAQAVLASVLDRIRREVGA